MITSVFVGASAASNPKFYCKDLDGKVGGKTIVTVGVDGRYENVGGLIYRLLSTRRKSRILTVHGLCYVSRCKTGTQTMIR